jgi:hypothetical protein
VCGICYDLSVNAHQTPCCRNLSCKACISTVVVDSSRCPYCREHIASAEILVRDVRAERTAAATVLKCTNEGCGISGKRDAIIAHRATCDKRPAAVFLEETIQLRGGVYIREC